MVLNIWIFFSFMVVIGQIVAIALLCWLLMEHPTASKVSLTESKIKLTYRYNTLLQPLSTVLSQFSFLSFKVCDVLDVNLV